MTIHISRSFHTLAWPIFYRRMALTFQRVEPRFLPFSFKSRAPKWPWIVWLYLRPVRPLAKQMLIVESGGSIERGRWSRLSEQGWV